MDLVKITRLEIISDKGRELVRNDVNLVLSIQDSGKTLKIFIKDIEGK